MLQALINCFKIDDLRNRLLFTIGCLVIYRLGYWIPLVGTSQSDLALDEGGGGPLGDMVNFIGMFTGGTFQQSTLFGLGILPYISAAIIFQLLGTSMPALKALQDEGPAGRQKIQEYTRYATFALCLVQSVFYLRMFQTLGMVEEAFQGTATYWVCGVVALTTGTMFLMWLGEQIDKYGIGNGASLIITAGIMSQMPAAIGIVVDQFSMTQGDATQTMTPTKVGFLVLSFVFVIAGTVVMTQGQRRIPVQQAKHTRGRRVYGGEKHYLPLRVNHGGVMPIIFASTIMMIPTFILPWLAQMGGDANSGFWAGWTSFWGFLSSELSMQGFKFLYVIVYVGMIYFFAFFWTSVQFQPDEMAKNLRDHGSFIPGLRPGPRTADYLRRVMERITYVGAGFLSVVALVPMVISSALEVDFLVAQFLGGTGLLITVSVALDFVQRIEANLLMRNYKGFLDSGDDGGRGPRIRGGGRA